MNDPQGADATDVEALESRTLQLHANLGDKMNPAANDSVAAVTAYALGTAALFWRKEKE